MKEFLMKLRQYLLTGVSFAIPFIACGGIMIAAAIAFAPMTPDGPDFSHSPFLALILNIGGTAFTLMPAILAGYIAYAIAGKPGLVSGFVGGWLATNLDKVPTSRAADLISAGTKAVNALTTMPSSVHATTTKVIEAVTTMPATATSTMPSTAPATLTEAAVNSHAYLSSLPLQNLKTAAQTAFGAMNPTEKVISAGFLGAVIAGLLAGFIVQLLKKLPAPKFIKPIMPILIIPILSAFAIGVIMLKVLGLPIADLMSWLGVWLETMNNGNAAVLAMILGAMIAFDMGGPVNKAAFFFAAGLVAEGHFGVMGSVAAAICIPPLGLGVATLIRRKLWTKEEREAGGAALAMGMIGITEGAIPFAASDPLRVIPCIMLGSMTAAVVASLGSVGDHAPHGGPIVIFVTDNKLNYAFAILAGIAVTAVAIILVKTLTSKPPVVEEETAGS